MSRPNNQQTEVLLWRGRGYAATHAASVASILGAQTPKVSSRGSAFFNIDRWTLRFCVNAMCRWAANHPDVTPTLDTVKEWVKEANETQPPPREIVIAKTPDHLTLDTAHALVGGAYHEAAHTLYSCRKDLDAKRMADIILPRWGEIPNWSRYYSIIQFVSNVIEDIRIERCLQEDFPGVREKLIALQEFILRMESEGEKYARGHGESKLKQKDRFTAMNVLIGTFRDVGLNYNTDFQYQIFQQYKEHKPKAVEFVLHGPARPILDETMKLGPKDDLDCLRLALDLIVQLYHHSQHGPNCPSCGASASNLVVTPTEEGKGTLTCEKCGWKTEVVLPPKSESNTDEDGNYLPEQIRLQNNDGEGVEVDGEEVDGEGKGDKTSEANAKGWEGSDETPDWTKVAEEALTDQEINLLNNNEALKELFNTIAEQQTYVREGLKEGEKPWNPYDPNLDLVEKVKVPKDLQDNALNDVNGMLDEVRAESRFLRARLRQVLKAKVMQGVLHGAPKGKRLSARFLVDSYTSLRGRNVPRRAYRIESDKIDISTAAVLVLDESGSMWSWRREAAKIMLALIEPLEALATPTLAVGFRDRSDRSGFFLPPEPERGSEYHRIHGICYDVFKDFHEPLRSVKSRFARTKADGTTPMSDGIQFGLNALQTRSEVHRILFAVTDGAPNPRHIPIIKRQLRLAKAQGIHVIGVGMGTSARQVEDLYPDHIYADQIPTIPKLVVAKLNELINRYKA